MDWLEVRLQTSSPGIELVAARLTALGYDSFIMDDQQEFHDFLEENRQYWDYVDDGLAARMAGLSQIRLYLEDSPAAREQARTLPALLEPLRARFPSVDFGPLTVSLAACRDEDWENNWKQYYTPLPAGERLFIVPEWLSPEIPDGRVALRLDPGLSFGTGAHASTQMCLLALEACVRGGERAVDLGCGSGILSIAALLLGAARAAGVDVDPMAEGVARANAALNGLDAGRFTARTGDVLRDSALLRELSGCELLLANIVADVIIPLAPAARAMLAPGGRFICSGILDAREDEVRAALTRAGFTIVERRARDGWRQFTAI